jgi:integrase
MSTCFCNLFFYFCVLVLRKCKTSKGGKLVPPYPVADDLVMYCLRHTYGTDLQRAGVSINVARELMGHSSVTITEGYTHKSKEAFNAAAKLINEFNSVETGVETKPISVAK